MSYKTEVLINPVTNEHREAPIGFSWTTLFFGMFPALLRSDLKWAVIMLLVAFLTSGISWFVFPFFYNNLYYKDSLKEGFVHDNTDYSMIRLYE